MQNNKDTSKKHHSKPQNVEYNWLDMHALADDQLSTNEKKESTRALKQDSQCLAEYETIVKLKAVLKKSCKPAKNKEVWDSIYSEIKKHNAKKNNEVFFRRFSWTFASCFVLFAAIFGIYHLINKSDAINTNDIFLIASEPAFLKQVKTTPGEAEKDWMKKTIASLPIKIETASFKIANVFTSTLKNRKVYQIYIEDHKGPLQLIVIEGIHQIKGLDNKEKYNELADWKIDRHHCITWNDQNHLLIVTSNRSKDDLHQLAEKIKK